MFKSCCQSAASLGLRFPFPVFHCLTFVSGGRNEAKTYIECFVISNDAGIFPGTSCVCWSAWRRMIGHFLFLMMIDLLKNEYD